MKVLMISIDKGLLGRGQLGDVLERHKKYGEFCERLDIVILSPRGFQQHQISDKTTSYPTNSKNKSFYFFNGLGLAKKLFKENGYDLIVCQEPFISGLIGYCLKRKFSSKLLIHFHGDFWDNPNWLKEKKINWLFLWLSKFVVPQADGLRVMSAGQKEKLLRAGLKGTKIRVISTPVDLGKYMQHEAGNTGHEEKAKKIVLHIGRDDEVKDYNTLINAFKLVKEKISEAIFWQAGADKAVRTAMTAADFQDVELKGLVPAGDLVGLYQHCNLVVLSSTSESFGKVLVEANACGKPVVSTATTGAKEIIQDGINGYLVPIGDYVALADKVIYLLNNPAVAATMGENGQQTVQEKFGDNTEKIIKFWQDLITSQI